ncbi:MAG: DNA gyrase inhibitor YacG [Deltaproteobacteria bacterium]|uniref:DNA gyrase inhibitor YacG n=1 Tax=Candidatus Zymogenus saltonus TaxID=2844893 RepID=A0A9D8KEN6_9DELT|nr:DNA gyrase inhibitor YacG [Candidatus Zymogenus saltonus]
MDEGGRIAKCPVCGKNALNPFRPFCSERCCLIDLARWFGESYRIETEERLDGPESESIESASMGEESWRPLHLSKLLF